MKHILFIGLGTMGYPMAGHLCTLPHHHIRVWNRTTSKAHTWAAAYPGTAVDDLAQAVAESDLILSCTGRDEDMQAMLLDNPEISAALRPGTLWVDHTTISAKLAQNIQQHLAEKGVHFLDAPVSGGQAGAENGCLTIMVGGDKAQLDACHQVLSCYAASITHMGSAGSGQVAKMANQICIAGLLQGLSEAIRFAEAAEIDIDTMLAAISGGAAQSWQMENRGATMHKREFDFGFAIDWMIKDLGYCLDHAEKTQVALPITTQVLEKYRALSALGHGRSDTSALILHQEDTSSD